MFPEHVAQDTHVLLVGCGGIGSYTASILARLGIGSLTLVDFDRVEATNVATQDLSLCDVGDYKVNALRDYLVGLNEVLTIEVSPVHFAARHIFTGCTTIMAVDSIKVRQEIYQTWSKRATPGQVLIDPRMGAESFELWVVRHGSEFELEYKRSLFDPTPRPELPCGARAIAYTGAFAGALTASAVRRSAMEPAWETWVVGDVGTMRMTVLRELPEPKVQS